MVVRFDPSVHLGFLDRLVVSIIWVLTPLLRTPHPFANCMALVAPQTLLSKSPCGCFNRAVLICRISRHGSWLSDHSGVTIRRSFVISRSFGKGFSRRSSDRKSSNRSFVGQ